MSNYVSKILPFLGMVIVVTGCTKILSPNNGSTVTPTVEPIPEERMPDFLPDFHPGPGETLSSTDFDSICIELNASPLLIKGDFWSKDDVVGRTKIFVDANLVREYGDILDGVIYSHLDDENGNVVADVGGPYYWCVSVTLTTGYHKVEVVFEKSDGTNASHAWTFELIDSLVPTPTLLPLPNFVDIVGEFPSYIETVYPPPGKQVVLGEYFDEWPTEYQEDGFPPNVKYLDPDKYPVCISFFWSELSKLGEFPREPYERIYFQIDNDYLTWNSTNQSSGGDSIRWIRCADMISTPGEHVATIFIDPFNGTKESYSWSFTIVDDR